MWRCCPCLSLALAVLAAPSPATGEEVRCWIDGQGRVQLSAEPPPGSAACRPSHKGTVNVVPDAGGAAAHGSPPARTPPAQGRAADPLDAGSNARIGGRYEWEWRAAALRLEARIESLEEQIERVEDDIRFPDGFRSSLSAAHYEARQRERIERLREQIARTEADLERLEDEARELGVPPGWLR